MRRLKPTECHMYRDGQHYFIWTMLGMSRKAAAVKGRYTFNSVLSQRQAIAAPMETFRSFTPFQSRLRSNASDV